MVDVHCPKYLAERWTDLWKKDAVILEVIDSLRPEDDEEEEEFLDGVTPMEGDIDDRGQKITEDASPYLILCDALYRFLVLFSDSPTFVPGFKENDLYKESRLWKVTMDALGLHVVKRSSKQRDACEKAFLQDKKQWSLHKGQDTILIR